MRQQTHTQTHTTLRISKELNKKLKDLRDKYSLKSTETVIEFLMKKAENDL